MSTIKQVKKAKEKLEKSINVLITEFMEKHDVYNMEISMNKAEINYQDSEKKQIVSITVIIDIIL